LEREEKKKKKEKEDQERKRVMEARLQAKASKISSVDQPAVQLL